MQLSLFGFRAIILQLAGLLKGSWNLEVRVISKVLLRIALLRALITPTATRLTKSFESLSRV